MRKQIQQYLQRLEREKDIKILLAVESGSRAWGFPSTDSDYDVRMIYVHRPEWYYRVSQQRDTIEYMSDDRLFDLSGWELRKALNLMSKTNPGMTDWLFTDIVYQADDEFLYEIRVANEKFYNPMHAAHHYASMARKFLCIFEKENELTSKKYLYFLRCVLNVDFIMKYDSKAPVRFQDLLNPLDIPKDIYQELLDLIDEKASCNEKDNRHIARNLIDFATDRYNTTITNLQRFHTNWVFPPNGVESLDRLAAKYITIGH